MNEDTKPCAKCKVDKPLTEYWKDSYRRKGYDFTCKACRKRLYDRVRAARIQREYEARNPQKQEARMLIKKQLKSGEIVKGECFLCGSSETVAHHLHYDFPDKVVWLCSKHHSEVHHEKQ